MIDIKDVKEVQERAQLMAKDFNDVLKKHGLENLQITNFELAVPDPPRENLFAHNARGGYWTWRCEQTPQGFRCWWVWVNG